MSKDSRKERAQEVIEEYMGVVVEKLDIYNDPKVAGCYVMRAKIKGEYFYFIKMGYDEPLTVDTLEEADFDKWPPKSGSLKFFV